MNFKKIAVTLLILLGCWGSVWIGKNLLPKYLPAKVEAKYHARAKGNPKAPLWIIEYLDFQCASCRESMKFLEEYLAAHPREIYLQVRYYPLIHNHRYALKSAIYADCAAKQGKFWEFSESLFKNQVQWAVSPEPDVFFEQTAAKLKLDVAALKACVTDTSVKDAVLAEKAEGKSLGITMTPTSFVNGKKIIGLSAIKAELEQYFKEKKSDALPK